MHCTLQIKHTTELKWNIIALFNIIPLSSLRVFSFLYDICHTIDDGHLCLMAARIALNFCPKKMSFHGRPVSKTGVIWIVELIKWTNLSGFLSMQTVWLQCFKKEGGLSCTTCWTLSLVFKYSKNLFRNDTKCSAVRMLPGTASVVTIQMY